METESIREVERRIFAAHIIRPKTQEELAKGNYKPLVKTFSQEEIQKIKEVEEKIFKPIVLYFDKKEAIDKELGHVALSHQQKQTLNSQLKTKN